MIKLPSEIVIFDTEFTAWEGSMARNWSGPDEYREIVQIGAIVAETDSFTETDSRVWYIRPVKNPILSDYFIKLTGISQDVIEREGKKFPDALREFAEWVGERQIFSNGGDEDVIAENCTLFGAAYPFGSSQCVDVRELFKASGLSGNFQSSQLVRIFGKEPRFTAHDALNDARGILDGLKELRSWALN